MTVHSEDFDPAAQHSVALVSLDATVQQISAFHAPIANGGRESEGHRKTL